jgi:peptidyl-prolyl cis-trans isomerase SurA
MHPRLLVVLAFLVASLVPSRASAKPNVVLERIVAVVVGKPIFLSELRHRAKPHLARMTASPPQGSRAAAEALMYRELLARMIDEELEARESVRLHFGVTEDEVTWGVKSVADANKMTPEQIYAEAEKQAMTQAEYRAEVRRQMIEGKWVQLVVRPRILTMPSDPAEVTKVLEEGRKSALATLRAAHYVEVFE